MRGSGERPAGAGIIALAAVAFTCAGCSHVLPLGPSPAVPGRLASSIVLQRVLSQPAPSAGGCPAGYTTLAAPAAGYPEVPDGCYRKLGTPAIFTSAAVTVSDQQAGTQQPAVYGVLITLPATETAALTAISTKAFDSRDPMAIIVAGKTWGVPITEQPLTNGQFDIVVPSESQALQLQRTLLQHS